MTKQTVNIGAVADDGTGDPARTAFDKVNDNFNEVYGVSGLLKSNGSDTLSAASTVTDYYAPGATDVAIADGGTGSSTASAARTALGLAIGTDVAAEGHSHTLSDVTDSGAAAAKGVTGVDANAVTGTAGTDGNLLVWNADGDAVDGGPVPAGGGGSAIILDLGDDGANESTDLTEIATTGDTNGIFGEPTANKLLIDVSANWPTADVADALATDALDAITEIAAGLKSGADATLITGTAGANGNLAVWNVDGDIVDGGAPAGGGDVSKVGTPVDNQVAVWTGDGTVEGDASLTWDGTELAVPQINLGGTILDGDELADPGADRLVGWDDSATAGSEPSYFDLGTGLGFSGTSVVLDGTVAINAQTGTSYTLVLADAGKIVSMNNGGANTLTIPTNASVAFAVGAVINVTQLGAGTTTVQGDTGVTVNGASAGSEAISAQYKSVSLVKHATDTWVVEGATT